MLKRLLFVLLLVVMVSGYSQATDNDAFLALVGEPLLSYGWPGDLLTHIKVRVGNHERLTGYGGVQRFLLGDLGIIIDRGDEIQFLPRAVITRLELNDIDLSLLDVFRERADWRQTLPPAKYFRTNFAYTVAGTTTSLSADEVILTPRELVIVTNGGYTVYVLLREVIEGIKVQLP